MGLLFGAIGTDNIYAQPRATFGLIKLYDGVPLVPALIGLFAISEALTMIQRKRIVAAAEEANEAIPTSSMTDVLEGIRMTLSRWWEVIRAPVIGLVVGIIPGAGASIAAFVAYQQARLFSKHPERFGTPRSSSALPWWAPSDRGICFSTWGSPWYSALSVTSPGRPGTP